MEQLVARRAHNPKVVGSSPTPATKKKQNLSENWGFVVLMAFEIIVGLGLEGLRCGCCVVLLLERLDHCSVSA